MSYTVFKTLSWLNKKFPTSKNKIFTAKIGEIKLKVLGAIPLWHSYSRPCCAAAADHSIQPSPIEPCQRLLIKSASL